MKKVLFTLLAVLMMSSVVYATPATWTDEIDWNPAEYVGWWETKSYVHDIKDDGFTPLEDLVFDYGLTIGLKDDRNDNREGTKEVVFFNLPGLFSDQTKTYYNLQYENVDLGWSLAGLLELNLLGELFVNITSLWGDFSLDYSTLTANGYDNAPVPEPSTLLLLGGGLLGLLYTGRKRMKKS